MHLAFFWSTWHCGCGYSCRASVPSGRWDSKTMAHSDASFAEVYLGQHLMIVGMAGKRIELASGGVGGGGNLGQQAGGDGCDAAGGNQVAREGLLRIGIGDGSGAAEVAGFLRGRGDESGIAVGDVADDRALIGGEEEQFV